MRANLIYFSQTGNTREVAKAIAGQLIAEGHSVRTISYRRAQQADFEEPDLLGVGAPCFESQAPSVVRDYLWRLPNLGYKKAFVFSTSGGAPGKVLYDLAKPLMKKGAEVVGGLLCRGTCFYPIPCLVGRFPERPNASDLDRAKDFARNLLEHIASGAAGPMPESRPDALRPGFGFYQLIGSILNDPLIRFLMPKPRPIDDKCTECEWCVAECPTDSMTLAPTPVVADTCFRCYRCMTGCPEEALAVSWGISNFLVWSLYNETFERWLGDIRKGEVV